MRSYCIITIIYHAAVVGAGLSRLGQAGHHEKLLRGWSMGFGDLGVCGAEKYPDGSYWH